MLGLNIKVNVNQFNLFMIKIRLIKGKDEKFNIGCFTFCLISSC